MVVAGANGPTVVMYNLDGFSSQVFLTGLDQNLQAMGGRYPRRWWPPAGNTN